MTVRAWLLVFLLMAVTPLQAVEEDSSVADVAQDSSALATPEHNPSFFKRLNNKFDKMLRSFSQKDTTYIEPQHYNFSAMIQQTEVFQYMRLETKSGYSMTMSPDVVFKAGPYFGYKWLFLGYTIDLKNLMKSGDGTYFDMSIYSNQIGVDLYYINNGSNFKIRKVHLNEDIDTSPLIDERVSGLKEHFRGFNIYYITNHQKYSYPAAFSQSTQQKRSAGSALIGIGYSRHKFDLDYNVLRNHFVETLSKASESGKQSSVTNFFNNEQGLDEVDYRSYTLSTGLGYNYVFAPNWLLGASLQAGLSYNVTKTMYEEGFRDIMRNISFKNFTIDSTLRIGLVYNNARWYAGMSSIAHTYNYSTETFKTSNIYGTVNIYWGINFNIYYKNKKL